MAKNVSLKIGKHKSRSGGLTKAGREKYNRETGSNLKAPQPGGGKRKKSFCARMRGVKGPMKKPNGKPTRKALALRKWKCGNSKSKRKKKKYWLNLDFTQTSTLSGNASKKVVEKQCGKLVARVLLLLLTSNAQLKLLRKNS